MELRQLEYFVVVAEELNFTRAAERLNMTQPPLSRQIRLLEHQVGTPLLERTNRVVRFTAAGKAFFPEAARILRLADEAASTARRVAKGENGAIAIRRWHASMASPSSRIRRMRRATSTSWCRRTSTGPE
jgi:DNA-binding transcriptional LysR family regulator